MTTADSGSFDLRGKRVWVAGHRGMVGSAILRRLEQEDCQIISAGRGELDLRRQAEVAKWMEANRADVVFLAAATVGGILANDRRPAEFLYDNLMIEANIIDAAHQTNVEKLLFLGSSCIYPKFAPQPMLESCLLSGELEPTNQWYAIAKIAGIKMCQAYRKQYGSDFISAMPTNLYGPGDNYDLEGSHVIPALIARTHVAKVRSAASLQIWGTGSPQREFLFVDDLADALVFLVKTYSDGLHINVGSGEEIKIGNLAKLVIETVGFKGDLEFDNSKPDGTPRKLLDVSKLTKLGWVARTDLKSGLQLTYESFLAGLDQDSVRNFNLRNLVGSA